MGQQVTGWYPPEIKPVHQGPYDVADGKCFTSPWFKSWNGVFWGAGAQTPSDAFIHRGISGTLQHSFHWRGLTEPAS